jgi:hypothetical protein
LQVSRLRRLFALSAASACVHVTLSEYEGQRVVNVRVYCTGTDGIDRPTPKGVAMGIRKLPELAKALVKAEAKAIELGLLDDGAAGE